MKIGESLTVKVYNPKRAMNDGYDKVIITDTSDGAVIEIYKEYWDRLVRFVERKYSK